MAAGVTDEEPILPQGVTVRAFDDPRAARAGIYSGTLEALKKRFPLESKSHRLELSNIRYTGPQEFTLDQQKHALLSDKPLHTPVTGHFRLIDKASGAVVDERDEVVMNVPYYTDRGTIINNGSEYTVANQLRLRPGVYTRVRRSGDVETQFNVRPGTGRGFRLRMEPSTGVVTVNIGHANMPLYPLLRTMGVTDKQMIKAWGADVAHANAEKANSVAGRSAIDKLYKAFAGYNATAQDLVSKERYIADTLPKFALDPGVTSRTLGIAAEGITPEVLLRAASKMFNVNRGEEQPDDRDNPGFADVYGIEDLYRERIEKDAGKLSRNIMWKLSRAGSLKPLGRAAFSGWHNELLQGSGLAMPGDNSNPMALEEQMMRVTRMGEGGIGSADVVTDEARQVNPGNLNFIDVLAGPENEKIGVDARLSVHARKGSDGKLYSLFLNRQGRKEYVACDKASDSVIGFPNPDPKADLVPAMKGGRVQMVPRGEVDYFVPSMSGLFSSNVNLNPMPTSVQGGRQFYGAKFWGQYLPTAKGEVPLVDSLMPDGKSTWSEHYGRQLGTLRSPADGTVTKVSDKGVTVTDGSGRKHFVETVTDFPFNGLTGLTYSPTVKVGDKVRADDMVAASNFVDRKTGGLAMGVNLRMAWLPYKGYSYEDAICISESAAKKLATDRLYGFEADPRDGGELGLGKYMSAFPQRFTKEQYATLDDNGVVREGTVLNKGDPIAVAVGPKLLTAEDANLGKLSKVLRNAFTDKAQVWDHDYPGTVVSSTVFRGRAKVNVKATPPMQLADKMCYDEETEVLTASGWKHFRDVTVHDNVATLDPDTGVFDYLRPELVHAYRHSGRMFRLRNSCLDVLVTDNHRLFVQRRGSGRFEFVEARDAVGVQLSYKKDGTWVGHELSTFTFPAYAIGHRWGLVTKPETTIGMDAFLAVLGMFLSEGSCYSPRRAGSLCGAGISIAQKKPGNVEACRAALDAYGIRYSYNKEYGFRLAGRHWYNYFSQFGRAWEKYIPDFVFGLSARQQRILFSWLMWGDGYSKHGMPKVYTTTSRRLADDLQRLCLHIGIAARICPKRPAGRANGKIGDRPIVTKHDSYTVQIINRKLTPTVNHSHVKAQHVQEEGFVDYDGYVYCCTMPKWHAIYVRRNGHAYWCGNSPRFALKGVVGQIIPDDKMPRDAVTNEPYDILMNPLGIPSRVAPGQLIETALGKLAKATGKQVRLPQDPPPEGWAKWASDQLAAAGVSPTADVFDPETGRTLHGIGDGYVYFHAMHHLADKKISAKGGSGGYTADLQPAKGGKTGAKRISGLDTYALIAHGATEVMKDVQTVRGTKNEEYWKAVRSGGPLPAPQVPFVYQKAMNLLRAGGINVVEGQRATDILPMTDADTESLSGGRVIQNSRMLDDDLKELKGGLFDPYLTGGNSNRTRWAAIALPEPVPNPVMEEPVRRLLGLTGKRMQAVLSGEERLNGLTGGAALKSALATIDVDREIERQRDIARKTRGSVRDNAVKVIGYLSGCKKQGIAPKDWMITKVPVMPPMFRPIAKVGDTALVSDINELYRDVIESADAFRQLSKDVPDSGLSEERLNVYNAVKAAYGLGDPISPEGQAKRLKGAIRQVIGTSPKCYDVETEILTGNRGWVGVASLVPEDTVATVNPGTLALEWQRPAEVIHSPYVGPMVHTASDKVDILVTPNHKHFVSWRTGHGRREFGDLRKVDAAELLYCRNRGQMLTAPAGGQRGTAPRVEFGDLRFSDLDAFSRFVGMYIAEGWISKNQVNLCQAEHSVHVPYIDDICARLGVPVKRSVYDRRPDRFSKRPWRIVWWTVSGAEFTEWVRTACGAGSAEKHISAEVLAWDFRYLRGLLEAYMRGDGENNKGRVRIDRDHLVTHKHKDPITVYGSRASTTSQTLVDDMANLCMRIGLGFRMTGTMQFDSPRWATQYRFRIDGWNRVVIGDSFVKTEWVHYAGTVHCCTVENGLLVVRRHGKTFVSGNSGLWQSKVISKAVDGVGRAVISPEPNYDMDQCGIPEDEAWTLYRDYVVRNLRRRGYPEDRALQLVEERAPVAKDMLLEEMGRRPVILDRAPTWHKFNLMAFWPSLVEGDTMRMNPVVEKAFTADHDGDTMNFHVPSSDRAVQEAVEKMLPSRNLFSTTDLRSPRYVPMMEMTLGLARLTAPVSKAKPRVFVTSRDAIRAYRRGEIGANDPVSVLRP